MEAKLKFYFYTLSTIDGPTLRDLARGFVYRPREARNVPFREDYFRLESFSDIGQNRWIGDVVRLRMQNLPGKAGLASAPTDLRLKSSEGVTEPVSFLLDTSIGVLVLQSSRYGITPNQLAMYFIRAGQLRPDGVELLPVIDPGAFERLMNKTQITRLEYAIAHPDLNAYQNVGTSLHQAAQIASDNGAEKIQVAISARALRVQGVVSQIRQLLSPARRNEVTKLRIKGRDSEDDNLGWLDLLQDRMVVEIPVQYTTRRLSKEARRAAIRKAFDERRNALRNLLS